MMVYPNFVHCWKHDYGVEATAPDKNNVGKTINVTADS
jgi:hypothetical protein